MLDVFNEVHIKRNALWEEHMWKPLKTIFGEKDTMVVRRDLDEMGIWQKLCLQQIVNGGPFLKLHAPYVLTKEEKKIFLKIILNLKLLQIMQKIII